MHSLYLVKTMLSRGAAMVCTDISPKMIKLFGEEFWKPENDFMFIPGNKLTVDA